MKLAGYTNGCVITTEPLAPSAAGKAIPLDLNSMCIDDFLSPERAFP